MCETGDDAQGHHDVEQEWRVEAMRAVRFEDVRAFVQVAEPYLMEHEAVHCLPLGLVGGLARGLDFDAGPPYMALVDDGDHVASVALCTPPHNLVFSLPAPGAAESDVAHLLADDVRQAQTTFSGVFGSSSMARAFAHAWQALTGQSSELESREGIYELSEVRPPSGVPGTFRLATSDDRSLLMAWLTAFHEEALPGSPPQDAGAWVDRALASPTRTLALWEDGGVPVSFAGAGNPTPNGIRIGPVYSPPERRGRGYASALVAELSARQLASGRRFCFLFTDLANPTANHIYQTIGYHQVGAAEVYRFGKASRG
jgi:predicted GNAT family acetyltransferase